VYQDVARYTALASSSLVPALVPHVIDTLHQHRDIVSEDIADFEYTPKPSYPGTAVRC
jgi:hypothetical protein